MAEPELDPRPNDIKLNDNTIRVVGILFFGVVTPNATGILSPLPLDDVKYWLSYVYFITLSALIWQGNRYLLFRTRQRFTWFDKPIEKLILLVVNNVFYTSPLTIAWLCLWYNVIGYYSTTDWNTIRMVVLINVICVLFITHVYETVFMLKEQQSEQLKNLALQRAKAEAELSALKNQVDPHFMFNSLNTLAHLIQVAPPRALEFTENLADVYRYILHQKDQSLVLLEDELDFTHKYTDLLHLRFGNALIIKRCFNSAAERGYLIPPTSVFIAFENAVKHNEISEEFPMHIDMEVAGGKLFITNSLRERINIQHSSRIGLKNLDERFKLITGHGISAGREDHSFVVSLPLVSLTS